MFRVTRGKVDDAGRYESMKEMIQAAAVGFFAYKTYRCVSGTGERQNRHIRSGGIEKKRNDRKRRGTQTKVDGV